MSRPVRHCPLCGVKVSGEAWQIWCSNRCRAARHQPRDAAAKAPPAPVAHRDVKPQKKTDAPRPASASTKAAPAPAPAPEPKPAKVARPTVVPPTACRVCGGKLPAWSGQGRPRIVCGRACANRAYNAKRKPAAGAAPRAPKPTPVATPPDPPPAPPASAGPVVGPGQAELVALARAAVAWGEAVLASAGADA
jgi:hypothetical protein